MKKKYNFIINVNRVCGKKMSKYIYIRQKINLFWVFLDIEKIRNNDNKTGSNNFFIVFAPFSFVLT